MNGEQIAIDFFEVTDRFNRFCESVLTTPGTRTTDPVTSHEAEAKVRPHASHGRRLVLDCLRLFGPATDFELAAETGWQQTSIGKRRGECVALGWVQAFTAPDGTKCKRLSPSGSPAIVWKITDAGRNAHHEMTRGEA